MSGVTEHGIRYPDGASKAKNLGPELETFAKDVDKHIDDRTSAAGIGPIVRDVAEEAVEKELAELNSVRAYPEGVVTQTTLGAIPMHWTYKQLSAPVPANVTQTVEGTWSGTSRRRGDVPVLSPSGKLRDAQIPDTVARLSDIPDIPDIPDVLDSAPDRLITAELPILVARLAVAKATGNPLPLVFVGSSTTYANPGFVTPLGRMFQETWRAVTPSAIQNSTTAEFVERTGPGVHIYNAGQSGTTASSFLSDAESDRIAALKPALIAIMVGSNDWRQGQSAATYKANLTNRIAYIKSKLTAPCQIVIVHQYERRDGTVGSEPWSAYKQAAQDVADTFDEAVFHDISAAYYAVGVPTPDPLSIISGDNIHQTAAGYAFMFAVFAAFYFA